MTYDENRLFLIMLGFGLFMGLVTLLYVIKQAFGRDGGEVGGWEIRGAPGRIFAIARTTLAEGLRAKVGAGFAAIIFIAIPIFYFTAEGDGTIKGRVQMFLSYSMGFSGFVIGVLTIMFSCRSLSVEIASKQIFGIASKPVPRWQIVAGKWVGVMSLNVALLTVSTIAAYAGTQGVIKRFKNQLTGELESYGGLTPVQAATTVAALEDVHGIGRQGVQSPIVDAFAKSLGRTPDQVADLLLRLPEGTRMNLRRFDELRRHVIACRAALKAELPDFAPEIRAQVDKLKKSGEIPEGWTESKLLQNFKAAVIGQFCTIPPGPQNARQWKFKGPRPIKGKNVIMSIRFKLDAPGYVPPQEVRGEQLPENTLLCFWGFGDSAKADYAETGEPYPVNSFFELEMPSECVEDDGTIVISFANMDPRRQSVSMDLANKGLEVLYHTGTFEEGVVQAALAILIPVACLASFGVCASTFLSFPVGTLIVMTLFIVASSMGFVADALAATKDYAGANMTLEWEIRRFTVDAIGWVLAIGDLDSVSELIEGRAVGWAALWSNTWKFVLLKGTAVFVLAVLVLRRRELATVIV
ncbi:MAG: ABC transporter permease subunit [Planctomycetota bacterium]